MMSDSGALVISIDYELLWGVRDHVHPTSGYAQRNILGERIAIPRLLDLFDAYGIRVTWAVVGLACLGAVGERTDFDPLVRPQYLNRRLSPFDEMPDICDADDPLYFGESVVRDVMSRGTHEIASHTYSHYYCLEEGQDAEAFSADCRAFTAVSERMGFRARSIVFPRNQSNPAYAKILLSEGIDTYRGNPVHWAYSPAAASSQSGVRRAARLLDAYFPVGRDHTYGLDEVQERSGLRNVRASFFLRPWKCGFGLLNSARILRIEQAMKHAATTRRLVHLWFHPHNVGVDIDKNLSDIEGLLECFLMLKAQFGMESLTMADVACRVAERAESPI